MLVIDEQLGLTGAKPCTPALRRRRVDVPMAEKFILMWILCCIFCEHHLATNEVCWLHVALLRKRMFFQMSMTNAKYCNQTA